jgi:hypothetical protein
MRSTAGIAPEEEESSPCVLLSFSYFQAGSDQNHKLEFEAAWTAFRLIIRR